MSESVFYRVKDLLDGAALAAHGDAPPKPAIRWTTREEEFEIRRNNAILDSLLLLAREIDGLK